MNILITGGSGFIGSNFIKYILQTHPDDVVVNLDKLTYAGNPDNLKDIENNPNYFFIRGDICDPVIVDNIIQEHHEGDHLKEKTMEGIVLAGSITQELGLAEDFADDENVVVDVS